MRMTGIYLIFFRNLNLTGILSCASSLEDFSFPVDSLEVEGRTSGREIGISLCWQTFL